MRSVEEFDELEAAFLRGEISEPVHVLTRRLSIHFIPPDRETTLTILAYTIGSTIKTWTAEEAIKVAQHIVAHRKSRWFPTVAELMAYRRDLTSVQVAAEQWVETYWPTLKTDTLASALQAAYAAGAAFAGGCDAVSREKLERLGKHLIASARDDKT